LHPLAVAGSEAWEHGRNAIFIVFDEGNGPATCPNYDPDTGVDTAPSSLLPAAKCYDPAKFDDRVVFVAITNYGVRGVKDTRFQSHYSLLKTIEAAFGLPYLGHAADPTTNTLAPLLARAHRPSSGSRPAGYADLTGWPCLKWLSESGSISKRVSLRVRSPR
jgi:hypothetical protein